MVSAAPCHVMTLQLFVRSCCDCLPALCAASLLRDLSTYTDCLRLWQRSLSGPHPTPRGTGGYSTALGHLPLKRRSPARTARATACPDLAPGRTPQHPCPQTLSERMDWCLPVPTAAEWLHTPEPAQAMQSVRGGPGQRSMVAWESAVDRHCRLALAIVKGGAGTLCWQGLAGYRMGQRGKRRTSTWRAILPKGLRRASGRYRPICRVMSCTAHCTSTGLFRLSELTSERPKTRCKLAL